MDPEIEPQELEEIEPWKYELASPIAPKIDEYFEKAKDETGEELIRLIDFITRTLGKLPISIRTQKLNDIIADLVKLKVLPDPVVFMHIYDQLCDWADQESVFLG